ncbi:OmpA family protein [Jiulongibacter sediminis]|jgi:outer membrane protein OmpA-like peptidoglycan-associated protein|uniref:OmpA family protein n=1 Tax=Jiulongibacter sediminis TaxID=1605367 RepID=UPI0026ED6D1B|nr:OmpA family protein [Jiulongibacter sediminis]
MKKLTTIILSTAVAVSMVACTSTNNLVDYDGVLSTGELKQLNYPLADTVLKYSMEGMKDWELTSEMDYLGEKISKNLADEATVLQMGQGVLVSFDRGDMYKSGQYRMTDEMENAARDLAFSLKNNPETYAVFFGRTDAIGSADFNDKLGYVRAAVVANYMTKLGVDKDRLFVQSYGEKYPDFFNYYPEGRDRNRRVDVLIIPGNQMRTESAR